MYLSIVWYVLSENTQSLLPNQHHQRKQCQLLISKNAFLQSKMNSKDSFCFILWPCANVAPVCTRWRSSKFVKCGCYACIWIRDFLLSFRNLVNQLSRWHSSLQFTRSIYLTWHHSTDLNRFCWIKDEKEIKRQRIFKKILVDRIGSQLGKYVRPTFIRIFAPELTN